MSDEYKTKFRFSKSDILTLYDVMLFPEEILCCSGFKISGVCAFCLLLKRFAYP